MRKTNNLRNTKAYLRLKRQVQEAFNFAVVVCYGVPALKQQISLVQKGVVPSLPKPDYYAFGMNSPEQLREQAKGFKQTLAAYTLLSTFSFFEAYVESAIREMLDYHGGPEEFQRRAERRDKRFINAPLSGLEKHRQPLRGDRDGGKILRYRKHSAELGKLGYRFPSELFSSYGVRMLLQKLGNLRAVDIPDLLRYGLHLDLDAAVVEEFHNIRDVRNRIAHGDPVELSLGKVSQYNTTLRSLAYAIDQHLNLHFLLMEEFTDTP